MLSTRTLFGVETEYATSVLTADGGPAGRNAGLRLQLEAAKLPILPHRQSGVVLSNGSRFYVDHGGHPELATPECTNPTDLVRYVLAGERVLLGLMEAAMRKTSVYTGARVYRSNVDYNDAGATWGCHESYLCGRTPEVLADGLIPHLVTRIIYSGAGGFDPRVPGIEFSLSPRSSFMERTMSIETTCKRGLVNGREESLAGPGYRRLHIIMGESLCSQKAMWLKVGTTALVVALVDAGLAPGHEVALADPLDALHTVSRDPTCSQRLELKNRSRATAVAIQLRFVAAAERALARGRLPRWAGPVCREWRATLNALHEDPSRLSKTLDWSIKRSLFERRLAARGLTWRTLQPWSKLLRNVARLASSVEGPVDAETVKKALQSTGPFKSHLSRLPTFLFREGKGWKRFLEILELRCELFELDLRFGQLGDEGIFTRLDCAGVLDHLVPGLGSIEDACSVAPRDTRAWARGKAVKAGANAPSRFVADWMGVWDKKRRRSLDLSSPFRTKVGWKKGLTIPGAEEPSREIIRSLIAGESAA